MIMSLYLEKKVKRNNLWKNLVEKIVLDTS